MDIRKTETAAAEQNGNLFANFDGGQERLNLILAANAEIEREKILFQNCRAQFEASLMENPLTAEKTFSRFGLLLGIFPPAAIALRLFDGNLEAGMVIFSVFINLVCAAAGFYSGKLIGRIVLKAETYSWNKMLVSLPFIGILWGIMAGGIGGIFIFVVGAFFGAFVAAIIGSIAVTAFTVFHRLLKRGEMIEQKHFLPLAFGITFAISALILGL